MNGLARQIVQHRKLLNQSQTEAADELGFTQTKLSRLELGHSKPYKDIPVIAGWLGISESRALRLLEAPAGADQDFLEIVETVKDMQGVLEDTQESFKSFATGVQNEIIEVRAVLGELLKVDNPPVTGVLADLFAKKRIAHGLSVADAADLMKVPMGTIVRLELGLVSFETHIHMVSEFLDVETEVLWELLRAEEDSAIKEVVEEMNEYLDVRQTGIENWETGLSRLKNAMAAMEKANDEEQVSR